MIPQRTVPCRTPDARVASRIHTRTDHEQTFHVDLPARRPNPNFRSPYRHVHPSNPLASLPLIPALVAPPLPEQSLLQDTKANFCSHSLPSVSSLGTLTEAHHTASPLKRAPLASRIAPPNVGPDDIDAESLSNNTRNRRRRRRRNNSSSTAESTGNPSVKRKRIQTNVDSDRPTKRARTGALPHVEFPYVSVSGTWTSALSFKYLQ
ncbi:hypothetical protein C8R45DRAFT_1021753 [Mycena sanguinolenta]|nr:hypothetical protein C8R45DRAFT_1021753 [Mycena sanguinolenta]